MIKKILEGKCFDERKLVSFFLRTGLAIVFLYAGIAILLNPTAWVGFIPVWLKAIVPASLSLPTHAVMDLIVGLWLISGKKLFYASLAASLALLTIIIFNLAVLDIVFRDLAILFSAVALMMMHLQEAKLRCCNSKK